MSGVNSDYHIDSYYHIDNFNIPESKDMAYCQFTHWCQQKMFTSCCLLVLLQN